MAVRSVLIADSNTRLSRIVGELLADEQGFRVPGVVDTAEAAMQFAWREPPDIILLSERLEGRPVNMLCERLRQVAPDAVLVVWSHDLTSRTRAQAVADAVVERGTTFRRLVRDLRTTAARVSDTPAVAMLTWADEHLPPLPPPATPVIRGLLDDPDDVGGLLLNCDSCGVRVRLATADIAPAVDEARNFFAQHGQCDTAIGLCDRFALSSTA